MKFDSYHPIINLLYFASVMFFAATLRHPVFIAITYLCFFVYSVKLCGRRSVLLNIALIFGMVAYTLWYSYYNHFGVTNLRANFIGNQITLEALFYGALLSFTYAGIIMQFSCLHNIMSTDKLVYLSGRIAPKFSLFISIALRMVPRIAAQSKKISAARRVIGRGIGQGNVFRRILNFMHIASITITWTIENLLETAQSMRCRGYGLKKRTAFSLYRFDNRDRSFIIALFCMVCVVSAGAMLGQAHMLYSPEIVFNRITARSVFFYIAYFVLCLMPMAVQVIGERRFEKLRRLGEYEKTENKAN